MISAFFLSKFYHSAVLPDTEVKPEKPSGDAISQREIKTEKETTEPKSEVDDLARYNKY